MLSSIEKPYLRILLASIQFPQFLNIFFYEISATQVPLSSFTEFKMYSLFEFSDPPSLEMASFLTNLVMIMNARSGIT